MEELPDRLRRKLDEIFGDTLPAVTRDELDDAGPRAETSSDEDLLADRPPHHDRG